MFINFIKELTTSMYIWNLKGLVQALKEDSLSLKARKLYKMISTILIILSLLLVLSTPFWVESFNTLDMIDIVLFLVINVMGIYIAFNINKRGDDKDFWFRFFCLFIPITLRELILDFLLSIFGYVGFSVINISIDLDETNWFDLIVSFVGSLYFNILMIRCIKMVSQTKAE
jgi:hypothetical protein